MNPGQAPNTGVGKKLCRSELYPNKKDTRPKNFETRGRKIMIDGVEWRWNCGRSMVTAYSEYGDKIVSPPEKIIGISPDTWERGHWKKTCDGMLSSKHIAKWIRSKSQ